MEANPNCLMLALFRVKTYFEVKVTLLCEIQFPLISYFPDPVGYSDMGSKVSLSIACRFSPSPPLAESCTELRSDRAEALAKGWESHTPRQTQGN